jgi:peptidyl-prolyl cis-trans isomerase B (cyclophilin B)
MAKWTVGTRGAARDTVFVGVLAALIFVAGCGKSNPEPAVEKSDEEKASAVKKPPEADSMGAAARSVPRLEQSFEEATISEPPDGAALPDQTMAGKSVGKMYTAVLEKWKHIPFQSASGKRLRYRAILETELGNIEITFRPDIAPNHVRSFVALARAGYYDGLVFERIVQQGDGNTNQKLNFIEAGCPLGTGEENFGSIGYWLKPEFSDQVRHEEGTVGAWHKEEADTAACKFYITLTKAPVMDGNFTIFGKVTRGLDVVHRIEERPLQTEEGFQDRPKNPVVIQKVTIQTQEVDD